ncbi:OPRX-like protein [Mya arenaria]|uniref:OPRX-like protein n=1 Tax=Mya arenaria TaxID=6604 RepID=A0ABY7EZ56_MYAAR|nr:OPRX-like protein [Mya arenaria]
MDALPTDKTPRNMTLEELNKEETMYYMGGTILVCSLAVIGLVGNLHVLFVYIWRMKQSNHRIFIICLGVLDLITCLIGMPFIVTNFLKPFTFFDTTMCKTLTFYNFFICLSSACVLIVIAVDRYRKICVPYGKQMSQKVAKAMCLTAMMLALLLSWPGFVIYGSTPIKTRDPDITGYECNILADLKDTWYPIIFNGVLLFIAFSIWITLVTKTPTFILEALTHYVPYLVLRLVFYTNSDWYPSMTFAGKVTFNTFLWCVYVNNMANPIIYGFCDQRFRNEVRIGYNSIFCRN